MGTWNHLVPFVTVMRERSFRKAAQKLGVTPAAMSQSIAQLERNLGVRLFHRTTRQLHPTDEAHKLDAAIGGLVEELDDKLGLLDELSGAPAGLVRLSMSAAFGRQRIVPVLTPFLKKHPKIDLELHFDTEAGVRGRERMDLAIGHGAPFEGYESRLLCEMTLILIASPAYLARRGRPVALPELQEHDQIVGRGADGLTINWRSGAGAAGAGANASGNINRPTPRIVVSGVTDAVREAALAGLGIAAIFADYVVDELASGALVRVLPDLDLCLANPEGSRIYLQHPRQAFVPMRVSALIDHLLQEVQALS